MTSYHEFNKYDKAKVLVDKILGGMDVAVITDAGTPGISDPGEELVKQCRAQVSGLLHFRDRQDA